MDIAQLVGRGEWAAVNDDGRPFVVYKFAATLDGRIAAADGTSQWITSQTSRSEVHLLRAGCDATVVGSGTQQADDPHLAVRGNDDPRLDLSMLSANRQPWRVIVDSNARTPADARVLDDAAPTLLAVAAVADDADAAHLDGHCELLRIPRAQRGLNLPALLAGLKARDVRGVFLEGGPTLAGSFVAAGLVDRVIAYIGPGVARSRQTRATRRRHRHEDDILRLETLDAADPTSASSPAQVAASDLLRSTPTLTGIAGSFAGYTLTFVCLCAGRSRCRYRITPTVVRGQARPFSDAAAWQPRTWPIATGQTFGQCLRRPELTPTRRLSSVLPVPSPKNDRSLLDAQDRAYDRGENVSRPLAAAFTPAPYAAIMRLQASAGNQAVVHLLRQAADTAPSEEISEPSSEEEWPTLEVSEQESADAESGYDDDAINWAELEATLHEVMTGAAGVAYGTVQALTPGGFVAPSPAPQDRTFEFFHGAAQFATGLVTLVAGGTGEAAGVLLDLTGVGAPAGVVLNVVSAAVMAQGVANMGAGLATVGTAMTMAGKPQQRWLPKKGTPERAQIEAARRQGIRAKQQSELANIKAGGKGSGVWTDKELARIRKTGTFPKDARWHHDPPVALRPDLAADPAVVRPVRGGHAGHLAAHGGDFRPK